MKVLATGMSPPQCGRPTQTGYEHVSDLWVKALRAGGADVEHRRVDAGEPLDGYDTVLVGLIPPNSIANRYLYTAFDVIARARAAGCGLVLYVDDWRFGQITHGVKVVSSSPTKRLFDNKMFQNLWQRDWAMSPAGHATVIAVLEALRDRPWPTTLIPAFTWGDPKLLPTLPTVGLEILDPSAFARDYEIPIVTDSSRRRAWVMGTFSDQREWIERLDLDWEVDYVGTRRSKADERLKEHELVAAYGSSWGVLGAPYDHCGSGWWRNRFVYAAKANAIMLADQREVAGLGDQYYRTAEQIEKMSDEQLLELANQQRALIDEFEEPAGCVTERLMTVVRDARNLTRGLTSAEHCEMAS